MLNSTAIANREFFKALIKAHIEAKQSAGKAIQHQTKKGIFYVYYHQKENRFYVSYENLKTQKLTFINRFEIAKAIGVYHA